MHFPEQLFVPSVDLPVDLSIQSRKRWPQKLDREMSYSLAFTTGCGIGLRKEQEQGKKEATEQFARIQGTGCAGDDEGRTDAGRVGPAVRHPPNQITDWRTQLLKRVAQVFDGPKPEASQDLKELHAKIGQLTLGNDFS